MNPGFLDHVIALTLIAVLPIVGVRSYRGMVAAVRADPDGRRRAYRSMAATQWSAVAIVLATWFAAGRTGAAIGLDLPGGMRTIIGLAITAAVLVVLQLQMAAARRGGEAARASLRAQIESTEAVLPRTPAELRWFRVLAVTAGVCEEVLFRGFLIAYLGALLGTWPAVAAGAAAFGVGHLYQGRANAVQVFVVGLLAGILYVGCGTLLWPMILHAALDLHGGTVARLALADSDQSGPRLVQ